MLLIAGDISFKEEDKEINILYEYVLAYNSKIPSSELSTASHYDIYKGTYKSVYNREELKLINDNGICFITKLSTYFFKRNDWGT